MPGEFDLIARLAARLPPPRDAGTVGIGDDCAALRQPDGSVLLLTCDIAVAGRHFLSGITPMEAVGWRVATAAVSDVAACGGTAQSALVSLGVPAALEPGALERLYDGLARAATAYRFDVIGGNVSGAGALLVDVFLLGRGARLVPRGGARPGDLILVSGTLGDEEMGRRLLAGTPAGAAGGAGAGSTAADARMHPLVRRHLWPRARDDLAPLVAAHASACIDISDGLASELTHLATASGAAFGVAAARLPLSRHLRATAAEQGGDPLPLALQGGEGYQLLFTLPTDRVPAFAGLDVTPIGVVEAGRGVYLDGQALTPAGWDHLRAPPPA